MNSRSARLCALALSTLVAVALTACGDDDGPTLDAGSDAATPHDAGSDAATPLDAGSDAATPLDAGSDAQTDGGPCIALCESCSLWPCETHCGHACTEAATTCDAFLACIAGPSPDAGAP